MKAYSTLALTANLLWLNDIPFCFRSVNVVSLCFCILQPLQQTQLPLLETFNVQEGVKLGVPLR